MNLFIGFDKAFQSPCVAFDKAILYVLLEKGFKCRVWQIKPFLKLK